MYQWQVLAEEIIDSRDHTGKAQIKFSGKITASSTRGANTEHFPLHLQTVDGSVLVHDLPVRMSVNHNTAKQFAPGMSVSGTGTVQFPPTARSPGGFDYASYLMGRGKVLLIYPDEKTIAIESDRFTVHKVGDSLASHLINTYENHLDEEIAAWVIALTLGDTTYLNEEQELVIDGAGARHLTAVSGLHVNIVALTLFTVLMSRGINLKIVVAITLSIILLYAAAAGFTPSVMRAGLMVSFILLTAVANRPMANLSGLCISFLVLISLSPYLIINPGFQLSYIATVFIILLYPELRKAQGGMQFYIIEPVKIALCAQLGILPLLLYHFGWVSLGSLLLAPLVAMILAPLMLSALVFGVVAQIPILGDLWAVFLTLGIRYLAASITLVSHYSPSIWGSWTLIQAAGYYFMILSLFMLKYLPLVLRPVRFLPVIILASGVVFFFGFIFPLNSNLEVYYLDVGQGDAIAIFAPGGETILIDGGGVTLGRNSSDPGKYVLLPFFRHFGIREIDLLILTHPHTDHFAGLIHLLDYVSVNQAVMPDLQVDSKEFSLFQEQLREHQLPINYVKNPGYTELQNDVRIEILHPSLPYLMGTRCDLNNNSIVTLLKWSEINLLFTGDLEQEGEMRVLNYLTEQGVENLNSQVLKVGHHGSRSSSTTEFLSAVSPEVAVIFAGERNPYGHPAQEILERLEKFGIKVFRTDLHGTVILSSCGEKILMEGYLD